MRAFRLLPLKRSKCARTVVACVADEPCAVDGQRRQADQLNPSLRAWPLRPDAEPVRHVDPLTSGPTEGEQPHSRGAARRSRRIPGARACGGRKTGTFIDSHPAASIGARSPQIEAYES